MACSIIGIHVRRVSRCCFIISRLVPRASPCVVLRNVTTLIATEASIIHTFNQGSHFSIQSHDSAQLNNIISNKLLVRVINSFNNIESRYLLLIATFTLFGALLVATGEDRSLVRLISTKVHYAKAINFESISHAK